MIALTLFFTFFNPPLLFILFSTLNPEKLQNHSTILQSHLSELIGTIDVVTDNWDFEHE